ncbi:MAG: YesL family protein [Erysipelotrichaceae bacterium]|nr:YesL family protein [Clostridia bacterium]MBQ6217740.1 YesL family protein [Erysipelotrichaceae bacterium]
MNYNSPFIKMLETIANMLIASFLWFVFSLPVLTIVPASAALYHTTDRIIFGPGKGNGVFKDFFDSFKLNLIQGIKLDLLVIAAFLFLAEGLWTGIQIYKLSIWGTLYLVLGILIAVVLITTIVYIPPVLSRFDAPVSSILRLAVYFALRKPLRSLFYLVLFVFLCIAILSFPLALVIVPGLYADLVRTYLEKDLKAFIEENGLEEKQDEQEKEEEEEEDLSMADLEKDLKKGKRR